MTRRGTSPNGKLSVKSTSETLNAWFRTRRHGRECAVVAHQDSDEDEEEGEGADGHEVGTGVEEGDEEGENFPERNVLGKINK